MCGKVSIYSDGDFFRKGWWARPHYACLPCQAICPAFDQRPLGVPANSELEAARDQIKRDIALAAKEKMRRDGGEEIDAMIACLTWLAKASKLPTVDLPRLTLDEAKRVQKALDSLFR